jgi:CheY-like chemotaxis protein
LVVVNCSGHTFPVEKHIMDEQSVVDVRLSHPGETASAPLEGLGSALERLDEQVTTIVVIDDSPMDSRLIRRLLQAKKPYRVFEANSAVEGLQIIRDRLPDLVVTDLTMPEMDGFALLEELKKDAVTARIPVIVVSAKDLTPEDKNRLSSQATSIWAKGAFSTQDLVEHVVNTLSKSESDEEFPIPVAPEAENMPPVLSEPDRAKDVKKVVLIEDNPMDARLISRILQTNRPLEVKQVQAGRQAMRVIHEEEPHLIVLDLIIPDMSGFQILEELRKDKGLDTIPVIVITSKDLSQTEREQLTAQGVYSMWRKDKLDHKKLVADVEAQLEII